MLYMYDCEKKIIQTVDKEKLANCILLGRYDGDEASKEVLMVERKRDQLYSLFMKTTGNYALVWVDDNLNIVTSGSINIYYSYSNGVLWFSDMMIEVEEAVAESEMEIDYDSCFYYISTGNFPPVNRTFWKNINKVPGEHDVILGFSGVISDVKWTFFMPTPNASKRDGYAAIIDMEARGLREYLKNNKSDKLYCTVSGVDSFNSFLALKKQGLNPTMVHADVNDLQKNLVDEFAGCYPETKYIKGEKIDADSFTRDVIIGSYKNAIAPFWKFSTDKVIINSILKEIDNI